jgi:hypothetical protein
MRRTAALVIAAALAASAAGCFHLFPPRVNLERMGTIGICEFRTDVKGNLSPYATRIFLEILLRSQPAARIKELGREEDVLREIGAERFSQEALAALKQRYGIDTVLLGTLEVSNIRPRVDVLSIITTLSASADIEAVLSSRLLDLGDGTTIWTGTAHDREAIAQVSVVKGGGVVFDAQDPERAYGEMLRDLVLRATRDFQWR